MNEPSLRRGPTNTQDNENLLVPRLIAVVAALAVAGLIFGAYSARAQPARLLPPPAVSAVAASMAADGLSSATAGVKRVVLAGGCFWGVQAVFQHTRGVLDAVSGYAGGDKAQADYATVSTGRTRHAEAVQITYDPSQISLGELLQVFFSVAHDPTEVNRQGPDTGPQYRSAVFYETNKQSELTRRYIAQLDAAQLLRGPIATEVSPLARFYPAESEHQNYASRNPRSPYIAMHDAPKLVDLQALLPQRYRDEPVLTAVAAN